MASNVVSPFSSGLPPYPTVVSHCSRSQTEHPSTTASMALFLFVNTVSHAINFEIQRLKMISFYTANVNIPFTVDD